MTLPCYELSTHCVTSSVSKSGYFYTSTWSCFSFFCFFLLLLFFEEDDFPITAQSDRNRQLLSAQLLKRSERRLSQFWDFQHIMQVISIMPPALYYYSLITFMVILILSFDLIERWLILRFDVSAQWLEWGGNPWISLSALTVTKCAGAQLVEAK